MEELERLGLETRVEPFTFNDDLYGNVALHFGIGSLGTAVSGLSPHLGFVLHLLAGVSYWADSTRRGYLLRRLLRFRPSQNVLATLPAEGEPALRVVLIAHADAGPTGLLYNPRIVRLLTGALPKPLAFMERSLAVATWSQFVLAALDLTRIVLGPAGVVVRPVEHVVNLPGLIAAVVAAEVSLRREIVPGANDNLSGVAALPVLAARLAESKRPDVELVFVVSGCEEASLGGADALAKAMASRWDRERTVILGLDSLANGDLVYLHPEGEVVPTPVPTWLIGAVEEVAVASGVTVGSYQPPVGGSDVAAFMANGYDGLCLVGIDPELGAPRHNHLPTDVPENLDMNALMSAIDFAEQLVGHIVSHRLG